MREAAAGIRRLDLSFDLILASPYLRALRTAEILAEAYDSKKLFVTNHLAADADPREVVAEINENFGTLENIVLVGHEPFLSGLISVLLTGEPGMKIDFKKAALCKLSVEDLRFGDCATPVLAADPAPIGPPGQTWKELAPSPLNIPPSPGLSDRVEITSRPGA